MIAASASAVNLADGLDGLATGAAGLVLAAYLLIGILCVPRTSSKSCDQAIFVDQATGVSVSSDAVLVEIDRLG